MRPSSITTQELVSAEVAPARVHDVLARHVLTDGYRLVLDPERSQGSWLVDARTGRRYLDLYTSSPRRRWA